MLWLRWMFGCGFHRFSSAFGFCLEEAVSAARVAIAAPCSLSVLATGCTISSQWLFTRRRSDKAVDSERAKNALRFDLVDVEFRACRRKTGGLRSDPRSSRRFFRPAMPVTFEIAIVAACLCAGDDLPLIWSWSRLREEALCMAHGGTPRDGVPDKRPSVRKRLKDFFTLSRFRKARPSLPTPSTSRVNVTSQVGLLFILVLSEVYRWTLVESSFVITLVQWNLFNSALHKVILLLMSHHAWDHILLLISYFNCIFTKWYKKETWCLFLWTMLREENFSQVFISIWLTFQLSYCDFFLYNFGCFSDFSVSRMQCIDQSTAQLKFKIGELNNCCPGCLFLTVFRFAADLENAKYRHSCVVSVPLLYFMATQNSCHNYNAWHFAFLSIRGSISILIHSFSSSIQFAPGVRISGRAASLTDVVIACGRLDKSGRNALALPAWNLSETFAVIVRLWGWSWK